MSDKQRAEEAPDGTPPTQGVTVTGAKRRLLVKAVGIGAAMPVVLTISRRASAGANGSAGASTASSTPR